MVINGELKIKNAFSVCGLTVLKELAIKKKCNTVTFGICFLHD